MNKLQQLLEQEWKLLGEAKRIFLYSKDVCSAFTDPAADYSMADADRMEAYTARFARLLDIYIQKILRLIDKIDLSEGGTLRDVINRAAGKGLIDDADTLVQLKIYRNEIAHDYIPAHFRRIFFEVKQYEQFLLDAIALTGRYVEELTGDGGGEPRA